MSAPSSVARQRWLPQAGWGGRLRAANPVRSWLPCVLHTGRGGLLVLLLAGGDKSTQDSDVRIAGELARDR